MKPHLFSYSLDGERWSITVQAVDEADARRRLSMAAMGTYDGIVQFTVPGRLGLLARPAAWFGNLFHRGR